MPFLPIPSTSTSYMRSFYGWIEELKEDEKDGREENERRIK
jgi:hypothetical protein